MKFGNMLGVVYNRQYAKCQHFTLPCHPKLAMNTAEAKTNMRQSRLPPFSVDQGGSKKHKYPGFECREGFVSDIDSACVFCYIGQTGGGVDDISSVHKRVVLWEFQN